MNNASPTVVDYLTKQLERNPVHQSSAIVAARAKAFKIKATTQAPTLNGPPAGERQKVREQLEQIRSECFTEPVGKLLAQLDKLPVEPYPDLAALAGRLTVLLESRPQLPELSSHPKFDGHFFSCLKKILISPARDVAVLREQVLASFRHRANRKRGKAMIGLLKQELPELYALEGDWLDSLSRYSAGNFMWGAARRETATDTTQSSSDGVPFWVVIVLVVLTLRGCAALMKSDSAEQSPAYQQYRVPSSSGQGRDHGTKENESYLDLETWAEQAQQADAQADFDRLLHQDVQDRTSHSAGKGNQSLYEVPPLELEFDMDLDTGIPSTLDSLPESSLPDFDQP